LSGPTPVRFGWGRGAGLLAEPGGAGTDDGFGPAGDLKLREDAADVVADGGRCQSEPYRDGDVAEAGGDQVEYLAFSRRQLREGAVIRRTAGEVVEGAAGDAGAEDGLARPPARSVGLAGAGVALLRTRNDLRPAPGGAGPSELTPEPGETRDGPRRGCAAWAVGTLSSPGQARAWSPAVPSLPPSPAPRRGRGWAAS